MDTLADYCASDREWQVGQVVPTVMVRMAPRDASVGWPAAAPTELEVVAVATVNATLAPGEKPEAAAVVVAARPAVAAHTTAAVAESARQAALANAKAFQIIV